MEEESMTEWILDRGHPGKTVASVVGLVMASLPLIAIAVLVLIK